jgi:methylated-DNA-[protein]-cysteine S-methyltransferase
MLRVLRIDTPLGRLTSLLDEDGVKAAGFTDDLADLKPLLQAADRGLRMIEDGPDSPAHVALRDTVTRAVVDYFDGDLAALDRAPLSVTFLGGRGDAWRVLMATAPGETVTLRRLMRLAPRLRTPAAAAAACDFVPAVPFIPSHRVRDEDGLPGAYRYTLVRKERLLAHERAHAVGPGSR